MFINTWPRILVIAFSLLCVSQGSIAQSYPSKLVTFVVPTAPGPLADLAARMLAPEVSKVLKQPVIVENRSGAGQVIGLEYVAKRAGADGYTSVFAWEQALEVMPLMVKGLRFDPLKDLTPVIGLAETRYFLWTTTDTPWKTFAELVSYLKANPGKVNYGSADSTTLLGMEIVLRESGAQGTYIPYSNGPNFLRGLLTGEVSMGVYGTGLKAVLADKGRPLAVSGEQRFSGYPDVPTFRELGLPQVQGLSLIVAVPTGVPKQAFDTLHGALLQVMQMPDVNNSIAKLGLEVAIRNPDVVARSIAEQGKVFADVARKANIQPQ